LVTHAGRFRVPHPDFVDIPPHEEDEPEPSYVIAYTRSGAVRFVVLTNIHHLEFDAVASCYIKPAAPMTRSEIAKLAEPEGFQPFVIVTSGGASYSIDHADYIDIPPIPDPEETEERFPSYVTVYNRGSVPRFVVLENIASVEFKPPCTGGNA
jgi:hypothetical protein